MKEGEKIAIGVGVGIGVPLLAAALFALGAWWALRRRRHQGKTRSDEQQDNRVEADGKPVSELGTSPGVQPAGSSVYELNAVERSEADGRPVSELPS